MTDVFISYSRKDNAFARFLHKALIEHGLDTLIDWQMVREPSSEDKVESIQSAYVFACEDIFRSFVVSEVGDAKKPR